MDISLQLSVLLWMSIWISLDFYGYPCLDLLWILDLFRFGNLLVRTWSLLRLSLLEFIFSFFLHSLKATYFLDICQ